MVQIKILSLFFVTYLLIGVSSGESMGEVSLMQNKVNIRWENDGEHTMFTVMAMLPTSTINDTNNMWLSVGINKDSEMGGMNCIVCQHTAGVLSVEHFVSIDMNPEVFDSTRRSIGLSDAQMSVVAGTDETVNLTCIFKRANKKPADLELTDSRKYHEIESRTEKHYLMTAFGTKGFGYHNRNREHTENGLILAMEPTGGTEEPMETNNPTMVDGMTTPPPSKVMTIIQMIWNFIKSIFELFTTKKN